MVYNNSRSDGNLSLSFLQRLATFASRLWASYWDYQLRRATAFILQDLDDRTLKDIGLTRHEIASAAFAQAPDRRRSYDHRWYERAHQPAA